MNVERGAARCFNFQHETIRSLRTLVASQGLDHPRDLTANHMMRRISETEVLSFGEIYEWLEPGELLNGPPDRWARHWEAADPARF